MSDTQEKQRQTYQLDNGQECSRAEYIRQEFLKNKSRREIAKELDITYNAVFSATANMFNEHHPEGAVGGGGRSVMVENPETKELAPRAQVMKELYAEGWTRGEIASHFGVAYATVYGATRDVEPPEGTKPTHGGKVMIEHPETGETVARIDYIREAFAAGKTRREIANEIGCDYSIVWMATRQNKDEEAEGKEVEGEEVEVIEDGDEVEEFEDEEGEEDENPDLESDDDPDFQ